MAATKTLLKYFKDVDAQEAKAGLKSIKGVRKLLAKPEHWIKENENNGEGAYCLIGAVYEVDGPGEHLAARLMLAQLAKPWEPEEVEEYLKDCDPITFDCRLNDVDDITEWNDHEGTKHKDILKLLDKCVVLAEKLVEVAPKKVTK